MDALAGGAGDDRLDGGKDGSADALTGGPGTTRSCPSGSRSRAGGRTGTSPRTSTTPRPRRTSSWWARTGPSAISFTTIRCLEDTDGPGDDEPYVVFWVGNLNNPAASYATRTIVFDGDRSMEDGDVRVEPKTVWGPAPITDPNDLVILASVLENDEMDPDGVVSAVNGLMLPSLLSAPERTIPC